MPRFRCVSEDEFRQINEFHLRFAREPLLERSHYYRAHFHPFEHPFIEYGTSMGLVSSMGVESPAAAAAGHHSSRTV